MAGNGRHRQAAFPQKFLGGLYAAADEILVDAHAHVARKFFGKMVLAEVQASGNLSQAQIFRIVGLDKRNGIVN